MAGSKIREGCFLHSEPVFLVPSPLFGVALRALHVLFFLTEQSEPCCFFLREVKQYRMLSLLKHKSCWNTGFLFPV